MASRLPGLLGMAGNAGIGSNSFVVDGSRTTTGMPILANDPHLGASMPGIWMQMGLHCRTLSDACPFDVSGFTFSGFPGVVLGHNDRIAWGFTNLGPDVQDLYLTWTVPEDSPALKGLTFKGGKFVTLLGAEVIDLTLKEWESLQRAA